MQRKIAIIGTGYVGLATGVCFAYLGHKVICVDKDREKIEMLKNKKVPIYEPGIDEIFKKYYNNIKFTMDLGRAVKESEVIFLAVGTPSKKNGKIEMKYLREAVKELAGFLEGNKIIINKSTVPVGTGEWIIKKIGRIFAGKFSVVSNPEFLREGSAIKDFLEPDRIVIGADDKTAVDVILDIYSSIKCPKLITDIRSAELIKYASNAFLAAKISFINEIANICERTGGDIKKVAEGIGLDKRIGPAFLNAGIGYGGSCFPKDIDGLISIAKNHKYDFKLLKAVFDVNENQKNNFVRKIKIALKKINGKTVGIWGLAFKPNTDDIRKSPAIDIIRKLLKSGFKIQAYDPIATGNAKKELPAKKIIFCSKAFEAAKNADVLVLTTDWPEFSKIDIKKIFTTMRHPYFFDGRNQFNPEKLREIGFYYKGIGRK